MNTDEIKSIAELIVHRLDQGWASQAARLYDRALIRGADYKDLEDAIFNARYAKAGE